MNEATLDTLCDRARPELACLGVLGQPLIDVLTVVRAAGNSRTIDILADPGFALDVLAAAGPSTDPALVGRVLDFLRTRSSDVTSSYAAPSASYTPAATLADAIARHDAEPLAMMAKGTARTYRTWTRHLAEEHLDADPRSITAGDLRDLIAKHVLAAADGDRRGQPRSAEEHAVGAYRHLWTYFVQKGWASENVAIQLRKPTGTDTWLGCR